MRIAALLLMGVLAAPGLAQSGAPAPNATTNHGAPEGKTAARNAQLQHVDDSTAVALHTGEALHSRTDLTIEGRALDFVFMRVYRSQVDYTGPLGPGWCHTYDQRVWSDGQGGIRHLDSLRFALDEYPPNGAGALNCATPGVYRKARSLGAGVWEVRDAAGRVLRFLPIDGSATSGRLDRMSDSFGNTVVAKYNAQGQLTSIEGDLYHATTAPTQRVDFTYQNGRIATVVDVHNSRTWSYAYNALGELTGVTSPQVPTLVAGSTVAASRTTTYTYTTTPATQEDKHNLRTITYPGAAAARVELQYDTGDHVTTALVRASASGTAPSYAFGYSPLSGSGAAIVETIVTDRRGNKIVFDLSSAGHALSILDASNNTTSITVNADGELTKVVYPEGNERRTVYRSTVVSDRFQHGNKLESQHIPAPNKPGVQKSYRVLHRYETVYNQEIETLDQGGTAIFDYQEAPQHVASLIANWGIQTSTITALGDVNGDGVTHQFGGARIEHRSPPITKGLPTGVTGPVTRVDTWTFDDHGRVTSFADAEGALTVFGYTGAYRTLMIADLDPDAAACPNSAGSFPNSGIARWSKPCAVAHVEAQTSFVRDGRGNILQVTDPRGVRSTYQYNALDEVVSFTLGSGYDSAVLADDLAALVSNGRQHLVAPGVQQLIDYDSAGNVSRVQRDNRGSGDSGSPWLVTRFEYDLGARRTRIEEALSGSNVALSQFAYDASGNLVLVTDAEGKVEAMVYDEQDRVEEVRSGAGPTGSILSDTAVTTFEYDGNGNRISIEDPEDLDSDGQREKRLYEFDGRDRLHRSISAVGSETRYVYDSRGFRARTEIFGRLGGPSPTQNSTQGNAALSVNLSVTDEAGSTVEDSSLWFIPGQTPGSNGASTFLRRDRAGRVVERVDALGQVSTSDYDGLGRVIAVTDSLGNVTKTRYDAGGAVVEVTRIEPDPFGGPDVVRVTRDTHDGLGRLIRSIDGGEVSYFVHSAQGTLAAKADGRSSVVQSDPLGLYTAGPISSPGNTIRYTVVRTATGVRQQVMTDLWNAGAASGAYDIWAANFNPAAAPVGVAGTEVSTIDFDRVGSVTSVTSAGGKSMTFGYDSQRRMTSKQFPDGSATTTSYWRDGRIRAHSLVDAGGSVFRSTETFYDAAGRTAQIQVTQTPAGYVGTTSQTFEWNGLNKLTKATDQKSTTDLLNSTVERTYDSLGRVLVDLQNGEAVGRRYDELNSTGLDFPSGRSIDWDVDSRGRLHQVKESIGGANIATFEYYGVGGLVAEIAYGNGTKKSYRTPALGSMDLNGYSASGRPLRLEHLAPSGAPQSVFAAAFDGAGNRTLRVRQIGASLTGDTGSYDSRQRLVVFQQLMDSTTLVAKGYVRNGDGEWTLLAAQVNQNTPTAYAFLSQVNDWAYTSIAGKSLNHDAAGNRVRDYWFDYDYDAFDRLVQVTDRYSGFVISRYSYDAFTRRIQKYDFVNGAQKFFFDGARLVEVQTSSGQLVANYVHGEGLDELVQWADGSGAVRYFMTDDMGSVVGLTDSSGNVVERVSYDAFGAPTFRTAAGAIVTNGSGVPVPESPLGNRFLFQGRDYDSELALWRRAQSTSSYFAEMPAAGQYNFRYRYASPEEGRFTSRDPLAMGNNSAMDPSVLVGRILLGESESPYELAAGNPVNRDDPYGLSTVTLKGGGHKAQEVFFGTNLDARRYVNGGNKDLAELEIAGLVYSHVACRIPRGMGPNGPYFGGEGGSGPRGGGGGGRPGPKPPKGPTTGLRGALGTAGKAAGAAAGPALSVLAVKDLPPEDRPVEYIVRCVNPFTGFMVAVLEDLEAKIENDEGLPVPSPAGPKEQSTKLFEQWIGVYEEYKDRKDPNTGKGPNELIELMRELEAQGAATSCVLFGKLSRHGGYNGPLGYISLDYCKPKWNALINEVKDQQGTGTDQDVEPGGGGGGGDDKEDEDHGRLERRLGDDGVRVAALRRFREQRQPPDSAPPRHRDETREPFVLALIGLLVSSKFLR